MAIEHVPYNLTSEQVVELWDGYGVGRCGSGSRPGSCVQFRVLRNPRASAAGSRLVCTIAATDG